MKTKLLFLYFLFVTSCIYSQVGIGTTSPNSSSMLDVSATNKGVLFPRVTLTSTADVLTITTPATGLLVYNTATAGVGTTAVTPGYYYWDSTQWIRFLSNSGDFWGLNGNTATATNFLGTTNPQDLVFRVGNNERFRFTTNGRILPTNTGQSIAIGVNAPAPSAGVTNSIAIGNSVVNSQLNSIAVGTNANTTGPNSISIGESATTIGQFSVAIGSGANSTNANSIALGAGPNSTNANSIAVGSGANSSSSNGIAIGTGSVTSGTNALSIGLSSSTTNNDGVAVGNTARASGLGSTALGNNTNCQGNYSIVLGNASNITGTATGTANSVAIGNNASVLGTDCIAIGTSLTINSGLNNSIGIGNSANVTVSNRFQLGNGAISSLRCQVALTVTSDGRFKYDIKENVPGLSFIKSLRPVTYKFDKEKLSQFRKEEEVAKNTNTIESGFIAQEVEASAKKLGYNFNGVSVPENSNTDYYGLSYSQFVVPLVKAVQEQQVQIEDLKKEVEDLKKLVEKLVNK